MQAVPGLHGCRNLDVPLDEVRLCACSVFLKLCRRDVPHHQNVPRGAYYSICIWQRLMKQYEGTGIDVDVRPHITNDIFNEAFHAGLIGTTPAQTRDLQTYLDPSGRNDRVRLIFEESVVRHGRDGRPSRD